MSPLIDVPQAVVDALTSQFGSTGADVQRTYVPRAELKEIIPLPSGVEIPLEKWSLATIVVMLPKTHRALAARGRREKTFPVDILIAARVASMNPADVDPAVEFADQVADFFGPGLLGSTGAAWIDTDHTTLFDVELLKKLIYTSLVTVTFQIS